MTVLVGGTAMLLPRGVRAAILYVDAATGVDAPDYGYTQATPLKTIQRAIDIANAEGDTIVVGPGTYAPFNALALGGITIKSSGGVAKTIVDGEGKERCATFRSAKTMTIEGFTLKNGHATNDSPGENYKSYGGGVRYATVKDCLIVDCVSDGKGGGAYECMVYNTTISRCNGANGGGLANCYAFKCNISSNSTKGYGGGVYYANVYDSILSNNTAQVFGGGSYAGSVIYGDSSIGSMSNCVITANVAFAGGGIFEEGGERYFYDCDIFGNKATATSNGGWDINCGGGGVCGRNGKFYNCKIHDNTAVRGGGALSAIRYGCNLYRCHIYRNLATFGGGGYCIRAFSSVIDGNIAEENGGGVLCGALYNCTVTKNTAGKDGGGVYALEDDRESALYCNTIVYGNSAANEGADGYLGRWYNSCVGYLYSDLLTEKVEIIFKNPKFRSADSGNYRLAADSPCINYGDNTQVKWDYDFDYAQRVFDGTVDLGAYEFITDASYTVTFNLNGASGTLPSQKTDNGVLGILPVPAAPVGWTFEGWYSTSTGGVRLATSTAITENRTYYAMWSKCDIGFDIPKWESWSDPFFLGYRSSWMFPVTLFEEGEEIYLKYAFRNLAGSYDMYGFVNRFTLSNGVTFDDTSYRASTLNGEYWGCEDWSPDELQNLAPGTYTLTCTLDATGVLTETNEGNNTKTITFKVVPAGTTIYTVSFNANGGTGGTTRQVSNGSVVGTLPTVTRSGYTFDGWYTAINGGTRISASTTVTGNVTYYAHWTPNGDGGPGDYKYGDPMPVTIIINNTSVNVTVFVGHVWGTHLPPPTRRPGWRFVGWFTGNNGTGRHVTASSVVLSGEQKLYAHYVKDDDHILYKTIVGVAPGVAASIYDGYLYDAKSGAVKGTIQVKVGKAKPDKKSGQLLASVKAAVVLGAKKATLKAAGNGKAVIEPVGPTTVALAGGEACEITLGAKGLSGTYGAYTIDGARNFFTSKDKDDQSAANAILSKWLGALNVVWYGGSVNVSIAAKGKAKVKGTLADGKTKVSAKAQFLIGDEWYCIPVVAPKANLAFALWLSPDGRTVEAEGLGGDILVGATGSLSAKAKFHVSKTDALWTKVAGTVLTDYLPDGVEVTQSGTKWTLPKAGKLAMKNGVVDESKAGDNAGALKLTYKAKDGSFKGSFKVYADIGGGKLKATTVKIIGVMVDGVGYGTATIKNVGSVDVTIE